MKLRFQPGPGGLHVVLVEPEIPQNTGNIARLCGATGSTLHLVGKLGFSTDEKAVRRAGLDYWHLLDVHEHADFESCLRHIGGQKPFLFTTKGEKSFVDAPYTPEGILVFGSETKGLPASIIEAHLERCFAIPTRVDSVRSLNLSNAVSIVVYEALKTTGALGDLVMAP